MHTFWEITASNALLVAVLALGVALLGRFWKNPAAMHLLWVLVLLKLVTPPLAILPVRLPLDRASAAAGFRRQLRWSDRCRLRALPTRRASFLKSGSLWRESAESTPRARDGAAHNDGSRSRARGQIVRHRLARHPGVDLDGRDCRFGVPPRLANRSLSPIAAKG